MSNLPAMKKPWEQWDSETDTAYDRFMCYLKMGPDRSFEKVRQEYDKNTSYRRQLSKWSSKYDWVDRCKAYDEHLALQYIENQEIIQKKARSEILRRLPEAIEQLYNIALSDSHDRMEAMEMIMNQAGMIQEEQGPGEKQMPTYQQINNYFESKNRE